MCTFPVFFFFFFPFHPRSWTVGRRISGAIWGEVVARGPWGQGKWMVRKGDALKLQVITDLYKQQLKASCNKCGAQAVVLWGCKRQEEHSKTNNCRSECTSEPWKMFSASLVNVRIEFTVKFLPSSAFVWLCWAYPETISQKPLQCVKWSWKLM